jgi:hypothetical protein
MAKWNIKVITEPPKIKDSDSKRLPSGYVYVAIIVVNLLVISIRKII